MASTVDDPDDSVAHLVFCHADHHGRKSWLIHPNDEFDIGRREVERAFGVQELTISKHHLKFRCVMYEDDGEQQVPPMIYVRVLSSNLVRFTPARSGLHSTEHILSKTEPDTLLNHGDILCLTPQISLTFETNGYDTLDAGSLDDVRKAELKQFSEQFVVNGRRLGVGGFASVFVAVKQRSNRQVACKAVALPCTQSAEVDRIRKDLKLSPQEREVKMKFVQQRLIRKRESLAREYNVLKDLNHPNIISLERVICATYNIYIFQELITGGDLLSYIDQKGPLGEAQTVVITRQLLKAVEYLHSNGIVHRDIKPENVLMTSWRDGARIVLTDFGQSRTIEDAKTTVRSYAVFRMQTLVGTYGYTAPEVFKTMKQSLQQQGYSKAIDMWSIGCLTATLLTNELLFNDHEDAESGAAPNNHAQGDTSRWALSIIDYGPAWIGVGRKAKDFVKGCLTIDASQRLSAKQGLLHPWFTNKHYAEEIEAAYQRAVQDWEPRKKSGDLIEFIDTVGAVSESAKAKSFKKSDAEVVSRHFSTMPPVQPSASTLIKANAGLQQAFKSSLPLPSRAVEYERVLIPASPPLPPENSLSFDTSHSVDDSHLLSGSSNNGFRRLSIQDFAPPQTQLTFEQPPILPNDSMTKSHSQTFALKGSLMPKLSMASATKPLAERSEGTAVAPYFASVMDEMRARKKVCR